MCIRDSCPFAQAYSNTICTDSTTGLVTARSDVFGANSICFASTLLPDSIASTASAALGCYTYCCDTSANTLKITLSTGQCMECTSNGATLSFPGFSGTVTCPDITLQCTSSSPSCSGICDPGTDSSGGSSILLYVWLALAALSLIHISEPTRLLSISYAVFCLKKKKTTTNDE
eukprot:TRINITY_DN45371_c0_g1_i2.p1 TRINITY_DN45371_c0_g1~~TRINITY_DN45371_c0_g1_i2.p1  ORF type:complete len:185 (-),score=52.68 TRINITY_DN45371_c0_g1_i2:79-600(-)